MAVTTEDLYDKIAELILAVNGAPSLLQQLSNEYWVYQKLVQDGMDSTTAKDTIEQWKLGVRTW